MRMGDRKGSREKERKKEKKDRKADCGICAGGVLEHECISVVDNHYPILFHNYPLDFPIIKLGNVITTHYNDYDPCSGSRGEKKGEKEQ